MILRDRNVVRAAEGDVLEERLYYRQNCLGRGVRGDVVTLVRLDEQVEEHVNYSAYGRPRSQTVADWDESGDVRADDFFAALADTSAGTAVASGDINFNGIVNNLTSRCT